MRTTQDTPCNSPAESIVNAMFDSAPTTMIDSTISAPLDNTRDVALDPTFFSGLHILLVDDNFLSREITKEILEKTGFTVDTAKDGQEELFMLCNAEPHRYDLILSDVQMPIMNGHDAARAIRALDNPLLASIPIIALSADYYDEDVRAALACGMNAHLAKPLDIRALVATLTTILASVHASVPLDRYEQDLSA